MSRSPHHDAYYPVDFDVTTPPILRRHSGRGFPTRSRGDDVPCVGSGDGVDQDLITSLRPDLVVSVTSAGEVYGVSETVAPKLAEVAPVTGMTVRSSYAETPDRVGRAVG